MMVGRFHAVLESRPDGLFLINLHPNGTTVNQTLVGEDGELRLSDGASIQLGGDGPVISLREVLLPPPPSAPAMAPPPPPLALAAPAPAATGPSPQAQSLLHSFSEQLMALNDRLEDVRDSSVPAQDILDQIEVIVSKLADLRSVLGIRPRV